LRKDGTQITAEVAIQQLPDGRFLGLARDVSQRRTLEQRLRLLSRAVEESPAAMVITDPAGRIEYVSPSFSRSQLVVGGSGRQHSGDLKSDDADGTYRGSGVDRAGRNDKAAHQPARTVSSFPGC
jgi:hypothetical protein